MKPDIYLHFMNRDARDIAGFHRLLSQSEHRKFLNRALNASALICEARTVMPPGFFLECEIAFSVVSKKKPMIASGLIVLPRRELSLEKLIEKKRKEYSTVRDKFEALFDDVKVQVLSSTMPVFVPRSTKIGETAAENWRERVDTSGQLEVLKASLESASVEAIRDAPMLVVERGDALTYEALKPHLPEEVLRNSELFRRHLQHNYFMLYVDEFDLYALRNLPQFFDFFALPSSGLAHSFQCLEAALECLSLGWMLEAAPHLVVKAKRRSGFIDFFDAFHKLGVESGTTTDVLHTVDEARKAARFDEVIKPIRSFKDAGLAECRCSEDEFEKVDQFLAVVARHIASIAGFELRKPHDPQTARQKFQPISQNGHSKPSPLPSVTRDVSAPTQKSHPFSADQIVAAISPDGMSGVFPLGIYDIEKTVYTQQRRALTVSHALLETRQVEASSKVAIVGGGVGGLTAGYALSLAGADVTIFELRSSRAPILARNRTRFIHPNIYDWPQEHSTTLDTKLPFLNWSAARSNEVATVITNEFNKYEKSVENLRFIRGKSINYIAPKGSPDNTRRVELSSEDGEISDHYDAVILATGFGVESGELKGIPITSYWENDDLENEIYSSTGEPINILVSGAGDGGLTDIMRATILDFEHGDFLCEISNNSDLLAHRDKLLEMEQQARRALAGKKSGVQQFNFSEAYSKRSDVSQIVRGCLKGRIRQDTRVTFNFQNAPRLQAESSCLNRVIVEALIDGGHVTAKRCDIRGAEIRSSGASWSIKWTPSSKAQLFDKVVIRHGPNHLTGVSQFENISGASGEVFRKIAALDLSSELHPETSSFFWNLVD